MAAKPLGDDTDSQSNWDACWDALNRLAERDLPAEVVSAEAARLVESYRAATEARGIEQIEERVRTAYRKSAEHLTAGADERLNRFIVMLGGALSVFRRVPRLERPDLTGRHPLFW